MLNTNRKETKSYTNQLLRSHFPSEDQYNLLRCLDRIKYSKSRFFPEVKFSIKGIIWILQIKYGNIRICNSWYDSVSLLDLFLSLLPYRNMRKPEVFYSRDVKKVCKAPCSFRPLNARILS